MKTRDSRKSLREKAKEIFQRNGYVGVSEKGAEGTRRIMGTNEAIKKSEMESELNDRNSRLESEAVIRPVGKAINPLVRNLGRNRFKQVRKVKINKSNLRKIRRRRGVARTMFKKPRKVRRGAKPKKVARRVKQKKSRMNRAKRSKLQNAPVITWTEHRPDSDAIVYGNVRTRPPRSLKDFEKAARENYTKETQEFSDAEVYVNKKTLARSQKKDGRERA